MKVMFDSGTTTSFTNKTTLTYTNHLPIKFNNMKYIMADGRTIFEIIGTVKIFIELNNVKTNIVVGVVNSLCTDCILGMDYINKYKVNLDNNFKQVQVHTSTEQITLPMEYQTIKLKTLCRLAQFTYLNPCQE
ncbi:unnamed protein product [Rotaria sp. Silwood2]|nr:unnamed protein product [Rotaria sp. Silwood2]